MGATDGRDRARRRALVGCVLIAAASLSPSSLGQSPKDSAPAEPRVASLMTMPAEGGEPTPLHSEPGWHCGSPQWSPDGKWVAYDLLPTKSPPGGSIFSVSRIMVVRSDGSKSFEIGKGGMPTWAPDSKSLAWHTYSPSGVVVARFDAEKGRSFGEEQVVDHWGNPVWHSDARYLISIRGGSLSRCDLHTGKESGFHRAAWPITYGYSLSPDGKKVAYRTSAGELILGHTGIDEGPEDTMLLSADAGFSSWSPDGKRIVFAWAAPGDTRTQLFTLPINDSQQPPAPERLMGQDPSAHNIAPDWSSDGKRLVFVRFPAAP